MTSSKKCYPIKEKNQQYLTNQTVPYGTNITKKRDKTFINTVIRNSLISVSHVCLEGNSISI